MGPEFVVLAVERRGWFSHEATIAARYAFTRSGWPPRRWCYSLTSSRWTGGLEPQLALKAGESFRLLLPRRLAQPGRLIAYEEIAGNPALFERWSAVPGV